MLKDNDELYTYILNSQYQSQFLAGVRQLLTVLFEEPFSLENRLLQLFIPPIDRWMYAHLSTTTDRQVMKDLCEGLITGISSAPVCTCFVPRPMRTMYYQSFVKSIREAAHKQNLLIDLVVNSELIGGISFIYNGLTYDFSLSADFNRYYETQQM